MVVLSASEAAEEMVAECIAKILGRQPDVWQQSLTQGDSDVVFVDVGSLVHGMKASFHANGNITRQSSRWVRGEFTITYGDILGPDMPTWSFSVVNQDGAIIATMTDSKNTDGALK